MGVCEEEEEEAGEICLHAERPAKSRMEALKGNRAEDAFATLINRLTEFGPWFHRVIFYIKDDYFL